MLKVVIGDQQRLFREAVAAWLSQQSEIAAVHQAGNSDQVLDLVCREHPELVLMDCELPGRDPFEAVLDIRQIDPRCKVLFWAERPYDAHVEAALACGANGCLLKCEPLAGLQQAIRIVMETGFFVSAAVHERLIVSDGHLQLARPRTGPAARLADREWELLRHLGNGKSLKDASAVMRISYKAADNLKSNLTRKLNIHDRVELARFAMRCGLVCPSGPSERTLRRLNGSGAHLTETLSRVVETTAS